MPKALAIVAHHDDHVLWMGGTIQRLSAAGWHWTLAVLCVPDPKRRDYFLHCCAVFGAVPVVMGFDDYLQGEPFSINDRMAMRSTLADAVGGQTFDLTFTHSRGERGEYWARHANHVEVRETTKELVDAGAFGAGSSRLAFFSYDVVYGGGTATCASMDASFVLPLTYPELLQKCQLCRAAPDAESNLKGLVYPCPNPEGFEGDGLSLPPPIIRRR